ncbi:LysR family transcriptional regulator [Prauserella marina]|uniref:DNA-binding transcriptional regulator, LysR family n=1 Tax=Prauserella marina TaxID=530584 RepID=A0A222VZ70_9PSEU|nr:LysR family transcriptional regulator [Prauserella marina]ASR39248.1 LysR family transcriptional regulator [Prauserella marina]PWV84268.1 DNA-binding transcriptional LysR family regulator [Prauserella marina]SDC26635.1 DNA-binding transcriptional regulator, LysR family [Prauserella marina]
MSELPDLRVLRSFVVIAEERSITRAAARLHISQQSLSTQMRILEARVGAALLERSSRGVTLTAVGEVLLREAVPLLGSARRAMDTVVRSARGDNLELRVGFLSSLANEVMPPVVNVFAQRHPAVELNTEDLPIAELVAGVRGGTLDAAITRPPLVEDLNSDLLGSEGVVIALPDGHRLANNQTLRLADLANERWVMTPRTSWPPWHRQYDADFAAAGYRPHIDRRGTTPQGLLALVAAGVGITRLAASAQTLRTGGVRFVPLEGERAAIVLLTRPGPASPALGPFRAAVLDALTQSLAGFALA